MYISLSIVFDPGLFDKLSLIAICNDFVKHMDPDPHFINPLI